MSAVPEKTPQDDRFDSSDNPDTRQPMRLHRDEPADDFESLLGSVEVEDSGEAPGEIEQQNTADSEEGMTVELTFDPVPPEAVVHAPVVSREGAELGKLLRAGPLLPEPEDEKAGVVLVAPRRRPLRWTAAGVVAIAAAAAIFVLTKPEDTVRGELVHPAFAVGTNGTTGTSEHRDPTALFTDAEVLRRARAELAEQAILPGPLDKPGQLASWASTVQIEGGKLRLVLSGDATQAARVRALLKSVSQYLATAGRLTQDQVDQLAAALKGHEEKLSTASLKLSELEVSSRLSDRVSAIATEIAGLQKRRDVLQGKIDAARDTAPVADESAREKLDASLASFQKQLDAAKSAPTPNERITAYLAAVQNVQEQGARLLDDIQTRHTEQADRLQMLKRRLDERMRIRQQQSWESDEQLKKLNAQLSELKTRLASTPAADKAKTQDLAGEIEYIEGLISSRKSLIGSDRGDQRALSEVQAIIDEQAQAATEDRRRLSESFDEMRKQLTKAMPEAGSVPEPQRQLASDLETRLSDLQAARAAWSQASSAATAKHQTAVTALEGEINVVDQILIEKGKALETARSQVPTTAQIAKARQEVESCQAVRDQAASALSSARAALTPRPAPDPQVLCEAQSPVIQYGSTGLALFIAGGLVILLTRRGPATV